MPLSKEELGKLIKKARKMKGDSLGKKFTQNDLAKVIGKSRSYIGDIEAGRTYPSFVLLTSIAEACDVPLDFFNVDTSIESYVEKNFSDLSKSERDGLKAAIKKEENIKSNDLANEPLNDICFSSAQEAMKFILEQPALMAYGGYDLEEMSDEEILDLANDLLLTLRVSIERRNK